MMKSKDMENFFENHELCHKTMFVDRNDFIKKMVEEDENYKYILGECIKDLRMLCEHLILDK